MGLEGDAGSQIINNFGDLQLLPTLSMTMSTLGPLSLAEREAKKTAALAIMSLDDTDSNQLQLLIQAQVLLKKSFLFQKIEEALHNSQLFRPCFFNIPETAEDDETVIRLHRDTAVQNLRFLNIFYSFSPATFVLAVSLFDRLLGRVRVHPHYVSCIATSCFLIAAKVGEERAPPAAHLVRISQCGGAPSDLVRVERLVLDRLQWQLGGVTALTFLHRFVEVLADRGGAGLWAGHGGPEPLLLAALTARLQVLLCHCQFAAYRAETLALALVSCVLDESGLGSDQFSTIVELQYYCQIADAEFVVCRGLLLKFLAHYCSQRSRQPHLKLVWTVSRRTLNKLKPSTRVPLDLEPIAEGDDNDDDAGPFDSENDDNEMMKRSGVPLLAAAPDDPETPPADDICTEMTFVGLQAASATDDAEDGGGGDDVASGHQVAPPVNSLVSQPPM